MLYFCTKSAEKWITLLKITFSSLRKRTLIKKERDAPLRGGSDVREHKKIFAPPFDAHEMLTEAIFRTCKTAWCLQKKQKEEGRITNCQIDDDKHFVML